MNKTELVAAVAQKAEVSRKDTDKVLKAFTDVVVEEMKNGGRVQIVGFGTFEAVEREARLCRNPKTGEKMMIEATRVPKFKAGKTLKDIMKD